MCADTERPGLKLDCVGQDVLGDVSAASNRDDDEYDDCGRWSVISPWRQCPFSRSALMAENMISSRLLVGVTKEQFIDCDLLTL